MARQPRPLAMSKQPPAASSMHAIGSQPSTAAGVAMMRTAAHVAIRMKSGLSNAIGMITARKTRGVMASSTKRYGELEPLAFIHAWRDMAVPPGKPHRRCNPKLEDVSRFLDTNLQELADLNAAFRV